MTSGLSRRRYRSDATDADAMAAMGDLFEIFVACDISLEPAELGAGDLEVTNRATLMEDQKLRRPMARLLWS